MRRIIITIAFAWPFLFAKAQPPGIFCAFIQGPVAHPQFLSIDGYFFDNVLSVTVNSRPVPFTVFSANLISANLTGFQYFNAYPNGNLLSVTTVAGTANKGFYTSTADAYVQSISPSVVGPGDTITFKGMGLAQPASSMDIGSSCNYPVITVAQPCAYSDTSLRFVLPGKVCEGTLTANLAFIAVGNCPKPYFFTIGPSDKITFTSIPKIFSVTPMFAQTGDTITITGKYLYIDSIVPSVQIGTVIVPKTNVIPVSTGIIKVVLAEAASGDVIVNNSNHFSAVFPGFMFADVALCPGAGTTLACNISASTFQWQMSTDGTSFANITDMVHHAGINTATLQLNAVPSAFYGYKYRCLTNLGYGGIYSIFIKNKWVSAAAINWHDASGWSCGSAPDAGTDVIIESGNITVSADATCRTLTVKPGAAITINTGVKLTVLH
jgi:hypothetical protein